jgi:DNA polymerase III delta prime subunit
MAYNKGFFKENTSIWVDKYRPKILADYIGNTEIKEKFETFISKQDIPHLLFEGPAGTGKSSLANLLVKEINCDSKYINASDAGIDTVRTDIMKFCTTAGFSPLKVMVLDEFSEFTPQGQNALRSVMEQFSTHTRFILTCNSVERIISPIRSRCQEFRIVPPTKEEVIKTCKKILDKEKIDYELHELESTVDFNYPDIRKCIQVLQQQTINGVLKLSKEYFKLLKFQEDIIDILKSVNDKNIYDKVTDIRQILADARIKNYSLLIRKLFEKIDIYCTKQKIIRVIGKLQEGQKNDPFVPDKEINIVSTICDICEELIK